MNSSTMGRRVLAGLLLLSGATSAQLPAQNHRLNPPIDGQRDVQRYEVAPGGRRVVFVGDLLVDSVVDLFSAPTSGSTPAVHLGPGGSQFRISPDGLRVAWSDGNRIWSAPIDGSAPATELWLASVPPADLQIDPTSLFVVVRNSGGLHRMPLDGSTPAEPLVGGSVAGFRFVPGAQRLVYAVLTLGNAGELHAVDLDGTDALLLNPDLPCPNTQFRLSPDGARVLWTRSQAGSLGVGTRLYTAPVDGSLPPVALHPEAPSQIHVLDRHPAFTPDGQRVVFSVAEEGSGVQQLYASPADGLESPVLLSTSPTTVPSSFPPSFSLSPDGQIVIYLRRESPDDPALLWAAPVSGSSPAVLVSPGLAPNEEVSSSFWISPDSASVAYLVNVDGMPERLFLAPLDVSHAPRLLADSDLPHRIGGPHGGFLPGGREFLFLTFLFEPTQVTYRLHLVPTEGPPIRVRVDGPTVEDGGVLANRDQAGVTIGFHAPAAGQRVIYLADQDLNGVNELYTARLPRARLR